MYPSVSISIVMRCFYTIIIMKGVVLMFVTYGDLFTFVLMVIAIISLVKSFFDDKRKK